MTENQASRGNERREEKLTKTWKGNTQLRDVPCPSEKDTNGQAFALSLSLPRGGCKSSRATGASLFTGKYGECGSAVPFSVFLLSLLLQHGGNVSASLAIRSSCKNPRAGRYITYSLYHNVLTLIYRRVVKLCFYEPFVQNILQWIWYSAMILNYN